MAGKTTELMTTTPTTDDDGAAAAAAAKALAVETNEYKDFEEEEEEEENVPPLHLHAMRIPARLQGSSSHIRSRSSSRSRPSSRSASPVATPKGGTSSGSIGSGMGTPIPSGENLPDCAVTSVSSASSLDGNASERSINTLDPDIFTDQKGFEEMEPPPPHEIATGALASPGLHNFLPPVSERLSEETLEDCHAFSDVVVSLPRSRPSSVCGGSLVGNESILLETLDECFEEDEEDDEENDADVDEVDKKKTKKQQAHHHAAGSASGTSGASVDKTPKKKLFEDGEGKGGESKDVSSKLGHKNQGVKPDDLIERLDHIQVSTEEEKGSR